MGKEPIARAFWLLGKKYSGREKNIYWKCKVNTLAQYIVNAEDALAAGKLSMGEAPSDTMNCSTIFFFSSPEIIELFVIFSQKLLIIVNQKMKLKFLVH